MLLFSAVATSSFSLIRGEWEDIQGAPGCTQTSLTFQPGTIFTLLFH